MEQYVTNENLSKALSAQGAKLEQVIDDKITKAVTDLSEIIANFAQQVDDRFDAVEKRLDKLEDSHQRLLNTIDGFISRLMPTKLNN